MTHCYDDPFCSECNFSFESDWNYRSISCNCVCLDCATIFSIEGFEDICTIVDDEVGYLYQPIIRSEKNRKKHQGKPTKFNTGVRVSRSIFEREIGLSPGKKITIKETVVRLDDLACPACNSFGNLKLSLEVGDKCPKCKIGNMQKSDWQY
jgi:hypothetical protein